MDSSSDLVPVTTILPLAKIRAVDLNGSLILIIAAENFLGSYYDPLLLSAICRKFKKHFMFAVETKFWSLGKSTAAFINVAFWEFPIGLRTWGANCLVDYLNYYGWALDMLRSQCVTLAVSSPLRMPFFELVLSLELCRLIGESSAWSCFIERLIPRSVKLSRTLKSEAGIARVRVKEL